MYRVTYQGRAIGTSRLETADTGMAIACGEFELLPAYDSVRAIFHLFTDANGDAMKLRRYYEERDALHLTLEDEHGQAFATNWVHIFDCDDLGKEFEVQTANPPFWEGRRNRQQW